MKKGNAMKVREVRRQKTGRRRKMYEDERDNVRVTQSPEKKNVCTVNIKINIK